MLVRSQFDRLVGDDGVSGVTSNPTIFANAFASDAAYREPVKSLRAAGMSGAQIYEQLSIEDVRGAADRLRRVYERTHARDGYVSIEVSPALAHDAEGTVAEAQRLWRTVERPNVMIKVPASEPGLTAIRGLVAAGVNVNATLVFGTKRYREVANAYLSGLEARAASGLPLERVASVASLFVSRIDTCVDSQLDAVRSSDAVMVRAQALRGRSAIAVARLAYQEYKGLIASNRWRALALRQAQSQRLLWASTSTKDARYSDVKYVDELIGRDTVSTLPLRTLEAYRDHGVAAPTLEAGLFDVATLPGELRVLGVDLERVSAQLETEGIAAFVASMQALVARLDAAA